MPKMLAFRETKVDVDGGCAYGPELSSLLSDGASDGGTLHLTLGVDDL